MTVFCQIFNPITPQPAEESRLFIEPDNQLTWHWAGPVARDPRRRPIGDHIGFHGRQAMTNVKFVPDESRPPSFEEGVG